MARHGLSGRCAAAGGDGGRTGAPALERRVLGRTGLSVTRLGFGAMRLPMVKIGRESYVDTDRATDLLGYAFDRGVNYVDTGFLYCSQESEIAVGRALRGRRDRVVVTTKATKQRMERPGDLRRMLEHQLRRMEIGRFDCYCLHGIGWESLRDLERKTGWWTDLRAAVDEGLVLHPGFSFHDEPESMMRLADLGFFEMATCQYNYLDRRNEEAIAHARRRGLGIVVMGPVGGGRLSVVPKCVGAAARSGARSAAALAIRFVLSNPDVDVAISGMGTRAMVRENIAAAAAGPLSGRERAAMVRLLDRSKALADLCCTGCRYCLPCPRGVDIPGRFEAMNYLRVYGLEAHARRLYRAARAREAAAGGAGVCAACGACEGRCPQKIPIVRRLRETERAFAARAGRPSV